MDREPREDKINMVQLYGIIKIKIKNKKVLAHGRPDNKTLQ